MKMKQVLAVLLTVAAFSASGVVAQTPPPPRPITVENPERCPRTIIYQRGNADGFAPGIDPVHPSLALSTFLTSAAMPGHPDVAYDDASDCDHHFGDTFDLDECVLCCGVCSATLEITLRGCGSALDCNDSITVGQAPFNAGGYVVWNGYINGAGCPGGGPVGPNDPPPLSDLARGATKTQTARLANGGTSASTVVRTIQLDPRKLAELVCKRHVNQLDVYIQDDQVVDFMRLIITKP